MNPRVMAVVRKELREYRRNKFVIGSMVVLPILFLLVPILSVVGVGAGSPAGVVRGTVGSATLSLFFVPLILPTVVSGYSVIGEREQGTLEPVLTTPIRQRELLAGKALAAAIPTVGIAYLFLLIFLVVVRLGAARVVVDLVWQPGPVLAPVLLDPLLALLAIWVGLAFSVRSSDVRVAQQLSALTVLPMFGLLALITYRVLSPSVGLAIGAGALVAGIDAFAYRLVAAMFDPERLLTRYGRT
jgi:ABC-type Na+ efflux pump permease subunit